MRIVLYRATPISDDSLSSPPIDFPEGHPAFLGIDRWRRLSLSRRPVEGSDRTISFKRTQDDAPVSLIFMEYIRPQDRISAVLYDEDEYMLGGYTITPHLDDDVGLDPGPFAEALRREWDMHHHMSKSEQAATKEAEKRAYMGEYDYLWESGRQHAMNVRSVPSRIADFFFDQYVYSEKNILAPSSNLGASVNRRLSDFRVWLIVSALRLLDRLRARGEFSEDELDAFEWTAMRYMDMYWTRGIKYVILTYPRAFPADRRHQVSTYDEEDEDGSGIPLSNKPRLPSILRSPSTPPDSSGGVRRQRPPLTPEDKLADRKTAEYLADEEQRKRQRPAKPVSPGGSLDVDASIDYMLQTMDHAFISANAEAAADDLISAHRTVTEKTLTSAPIACNACSKKMTDVAHRCSRCKSVFYCNKACQISHWRKSHKSSCTKK